MRTLSLEAVEGVESRRKGMLRQSENIVHRLFERQIHRARPNTHIHQARKFYENIVPSHTVYDVDCPDHSFRKFTNDGQYLVCFSRNHQDLLVYRHKWLSFCLDGATADQLLELPLKSRKFDSYFSLLYTISLASGTEVICKDFFLSTENGLYGIFASSTPPDVSAAATRGAVPGVPCTEKITIFLVSLADGLVTDERVYRDDFIHLAHNMGVFLYDDLLAVLSIRFQSIRMLQIRETGRFVDVRTIGTHCREDDELVLNSQSQEEELFRKQQASIRKARGFPVQVDVADPGKLLDSRGGAWPPIWNLGLKSQQSSRNGIRNRSRASRSTSYDTRNAVISGQSGRMDDASGTADPGVNGVYGEIQDADLDVQYDNYFRGLFSNLEDTAANQGDRLEGRIADRPTTNGQDSLISSRQQRITSSPQLTATGNVHHPGGLERVASSPREGPVSNGHFHGGSERVGSTTQRVSPSNGHHPSGVELRAAYAPLDTVYGRVNTGRNADVSTSGSGGHYSSAGPSGFGRSYTSTSGDSLDRYTSGGGSSSVRHTSGGGSSSLRRTSPTVTSSDSGSRSEGSRRDRSVSGGSRSYGTGSGVNGSGGVRSSNGSFVEYVVSSRAQLDTGNFSDEPSVRNGYTNGSTESRMLSRGPRENGQSLVSHAGTSTGTGHPSEHRWTQGTVADDSRLLSDHAIPLRFSGSGERSTAATDRAMPQAGPTDGAPGYLRHSNNESRGRRATNTQMSARSGQESESGIGVGHGDEKDEGQVLGGIKQRLLSFIFQDAWSEDSPMLKAQRLKRFYFHFQNYVDLVMWKVQFLDRYHLLIKFGSADGVLQRNSETSLQTAFLAVYNLETTEMVGFYQNTSEEFLLSFEQYCDQFRVAPRYPLYMNFISSYSNNSHVREQLRKQRAASSCTKSGSFTQVVKRTLAWIPFNSQCQSPSPYFDQSLFHYDEKLISAMDRHKPCMEHPIKFISRRRPNSLKFKVNPGPELGTNDGRSKRVVSFIFHPIFPFAISIQQSFMQPSIVNFHFRK